jgi:hypothetical protein
MWKRRASVQRARKRGSSFEESSPVVASKDEIVPTWDLAMAQVASNDREIDRAIARIDQNFTYMFTVLAAFIAAQLALKGVFANFNRNPTDYLLIALLGLWFPANHVVHSIDLVTAGLWRRQVLFPTVSKFANIVARQLEDKCIRRRALALNSMDWETFRQERIFEAAPMFGIMNMLWFLKGALLYLPTIFATGRYVSLQLRASARGPTWLDVALLIVLVLVSAVVLIANVRQANLPLIYRKAKQTGLLSASGQLAGDATSGG